MKSKKNMNIIFIICIIILFLCLYTIVFKEYYLIYVDNNIEYEIADLLNNEKKIKTKNNIMFIKLQLCFPDGERYYIYYSNLKKEKITTSDNDSGKTREFIVTNGINIDKLSYIILGSDIIIIMLLLLLKKNKNNLS